MIQNNRGNALLGVGEREGSTTQIQEAVAAYSAALEERTHENVPLEWARSQSHLGEAIQLLAEREGRIEPLKEDLDALQGSLEVYQKAGMTQRATDLAKKLGTMRTRIAAARSR